MISAETAARLYAAAFAGQGRAWSPAELEQLFAQRGAVLVGHAQGFALARLIADEAELLTIAVAPDTRRQGYGQALLEAVEARVRDLGGARIFLEVAQDNAAARALYEGSGYRPQGRRAGYYDRGQHRVDALLLVKVLSEGAGEV